MAPVQPTTRRRFVIGGTAIFGGLGTAGIGAADAHDRRPVRAVSFNIRYDNPEDEHPWDVRFSRVTDTIRELEPDLLGVQEAQPNQYDDLRGELDEYGWHAAGREDGEREGEMVPIAWHKDRFEALDMGEFWLSETPDEPGSVGWDAELPRVTMWTHLRDRETGDELWHYNTHFDHIGEQARLESARLLRDRAGDQVTDGYPVVVTGDFNAPPYSSPYCAIVARTSETDSPPLVDTRRIADTVRGPEGTFHGFTNELEDRIDYIFVSEGVAVDEYRALPIREDAYRSDHLPLVTVLYPWS